MIVRDLALKLVNPIRDTLDRTCMYASDIAINDDGREPVPFALGEDLRLTDAEGTHMWVRIVEITGRSVLLEYRSRR